MHWAWPDWTRFSTLRVRLAVWNTAVVLLMTAASLVAARIVARATLYDDADAELRAGALEVVLAIQDLSPNLDAAVAQIRRMARSHEQRGWFVHLLTEDGVTVWKSQLCPEQVAGFPPANTDRDEVVVQVGPYRYVRLRIVEPDQPVYHLRVGTYTTGLDDRLSSLMRQLTVVGSALLLLTPFAGWWLARRATQPVGDILQVADALRPTRLADRLPVRGTRDELDRLSQTINRLLDEVAGHVDRQRQFIADAAHELRGPLAAMQSALEVAAGKPRRAEEYQQTVESVLEECRRLTRVANDLLRLAEGESDGGQEQRLEVDLAPLVRRMGNMFSGAAEERGIRIRVATPESVAVRCRPRQLGQVCSNLLDNAIRFTPSGGSVDVTLAIDGPRHEATLTVEDTGRGIEPAILPKVFDRFFQADAARDRGDASRGGGLGLAICKAIVDGHGGSIQATSRPGRGSTFVVRLPLA